MTDEYGWTPLIHAVVEGDYEKAKRLIDVGANVNARTNYGMTAFIAAVHEENVPLMYLLVDSGAIVEVIDYHGDNAFKYTNNYEIELILLRLGLRSQQVYVSSKGMDEFKKILKRKDATLEASLRYGDRDVAGLCGEYV